MIFTISVLDTVPLDTIYTNYKRYIKGLGQFRLCTADYALVTSSLFHYGSLDT
jgi:hypothetical protein